MPGSPGPSTGLQDHPMFHGFPEDPFNEVSTLPDPSLPRYHGWHGTISPSLREHLVLKLVLTINPEAKEYNPPKDLLKYCRSEELQIFRGAQNKEEYFRSVQKKLETIRKDYYCPPWLFEVFRGDPFHKRKKNFKYDQNWQNEMMLPTRKHLRWVLAQILRYNYSHEHPDDPTDYVIILDEAETIEKEIFARCTSRRQYYNAVAEKVLDLIGSRDISFYVLGISKIEPKDDIEYLHPPRHCQPGNRDFIRDSLIGFLHAIGCEVGRSEGATKETPKCPEECEKFQCVIAHMKICPNFELCEERTCTAAWEIISQFERCEVRKCETCTAVNEGVVDTPLEKQLPALFSLVKPKSRYLLHPMFFNFDGDPFYPQDFIKKDVRTHLRQILEDSIISGKRRKRAYAKKKEQENYLKSKCREEYFELMEQELRAAGEDIREWRQWLFEGFAEDPFLGVDVPVVEPRRSARNAGPRENDPVPSVTAPAQSGSQPSGSQESTIRNPESQKLEPTASGLSNGPDRPVSPGLGASQGPGSQESSSQGFADPGILSQDSRNQGSGGQNPAPTTSEPPTSSQGSSSSAPENPGSNIPGPSNQGPQNSAPSPQKPWHQWITVEIRAHLREVLLRSFRPRNYREDFPREPRLILTKYCGGVEEKWYRTSESRDAYYKSIAKSYKAINKEIHGYEEIQTTKQYEDFFELIDVKVNMDLTDLEDEDRFLEEVNLTRKRRLVKRRNHDEGSEDSESDSGSEDPGAGPSKKLKKLRRPAPPVSSAPGPSGAPRKGPDSDGYESPSEDDEWDEKDNDLETCFLYNDRMLI
ncbi:hypothetical protein CAEBREN_00246 [Caenorhabditis brenneri]|uniref:histone acetyltransferase n=1 Tax=Caenorhabditis brenneri TaxID=135651 RepID=G0NEB3_CAEBE|nr:hypothetical protein CAEBREN_00246 [Caenorhabditis brenneri]